MKIHTLHIAHIPNWFPPNHYFAFFIVNLSMWSGTICVCVCVLMLGEMYMCILTTKEMNFSQWVMTLCWKSNFPIFYGTVWRCLWTCRYRFVLSHGFDGMWAIFARSQHITQMCSHKSVKLNSRWESVQTGWQSIHWKRFRFCRRKMEGRGVPIEGMKCFWHLFYRNTFEMKSISAHTKSSTHPSKIGMTDDASSGCAIQTLRLTTGRHQIYWA